MRQRKPDWLKVRLTGMEELARVEKMLRSLSLHTVCEEARCPNKVECFGKRTATFMILGSICTRNCTFCSVTKGRPDPVDSEEPFRVVNAVRQMNLKHVVITSVTRDDLPDGGAGQFARVINVLQESVQDIVVEVLIPDFQGDEKALMKVVEARPNIINHNVETVPRSYHDIRPQANYQRSLKLLGKVKEMDSGILTKSGLMLGLGEMSKEVEAVLRDLRNVGCDLLTIGQYLAPSDKHYPLQEYVHPAVFDEWGKIGMDMGFRHVASAPLVRSSYHAGQFFQEITN